MESSSRAVNSCNRGRPVLLLQLAFVAYLRQFCVQFRTHQHGKACPVQPHQQCNGGTERSIGFVECAKVTKISAEQIRQADPAAHRKNRSGQRGEETLFDVWSQEIESFNRKDGEPHCNSPVDIRPEQNEHCRQVNPTSEPFSKSWPHNHYG